MILIGKVIKAQGIKGEIKILPITPDPSRYELLKEVTLSKKESLNNIENDVVLADGKMFAINNLKYLSAKKFVVLKLEGIETREAAEMLRGYNVFISDEFQLELQEDQFFVHELVGLVVYDENERLIGKVNNVMNTGANDVFEITSEDGKEFLVPFIKDADCDVNLIKRTLIINSDFLVS